MDPASAIGVASGILTFIEAAYKVIQTTKEVFSSGTTRENEHIAIVLSDLQHATKGLNVSLASRSEHEVELAKLIDHCLSLSQVLDELLSKLSVTARNRLWKSLKIAISSFEKQKQIASIEKRLDTYRQQIILRLNLMLFNNQSDIKQELVKLETSGFRLKNQTAKQMQTICKEIELQSRQLQLGTTAEGDNKERKNSSNINRGLDGINKLLARLESVVTSMPMENKVLECLYFDSMFRREDSVDPPDGESFCWLTEDLRLTDEVEKKPPADPYVSSMSWVWDDNQEQQLRRNAIACFQSFLGSDSGELLYLCGKAGSGKSTLMKFLAYNEKVNHILSAWAGTRRLVLIRVFFWNSGNKLQMSKEGFYRSVLYETLRQCPELIGIAFPSTVRHAAFRSKRYRLPELIRALDYLMNHKSDSLRLCFFVDGLDEYAGDSLDHSNLAKSLLSWTKSDEIKVLCSARPHTEFTSVFVKPGATLHVHTLTRGDIRHFAQASFTEHQVEAMLERSQVSELVDTIVDMSDGVFLWARLTVRSLIKGMLHHDSFDALQERLEHTPKDLDTLFKKMLDEVDPAVRRRSERMLLLAINNPMPDPMNAMVYSWLDELQDETFPLAAGYEGYADTEVNRRLEAVRHQLDALTRGLLEIRGKIKEYSAPKPCAAGDLEVPTSRNIVQRVQQYPYISFKVEFFHRTVKDYLKYEWKPMMISDYNLESEFVAYLRLHLAEVKFLPQDVICLHGHLSNNLTGNVPSRPGADFDAIGWLCKTFFIKNLGCAFPFRYVDEFRRVIDEKRILTSHWSCPERMCVLQPATHVIFKGILGIVKGRKWITSFSMSGPGSFLHCAAWMGLSTYIQEYARQEGMASLSQLNTATHNLLLTAAMSDKIDLMQFLLSQDICPNSEIQVNIKYEHPTDAAESRPSSVWMVFLRYILTCIFSPLASKTKQVLADLIRAGANQDVVIIGFKVEDVKVGPTSEIPYVTEAIYIELPQILASVLEGTKLLGLEMLPARADDWKLGRLGTDPWWSSFGTRAPGAESLIHLPILDSKYRRVSFAELQTTDYWILGVATRHMDLLGDFTFALF